LRVLGVNAANGRYKGRIWVNHLDLIYIVGWMGIVGIGGKMLKNARQQSAKWLLPEKQLEIQWEWCYIEYSGLCMVPNILNPDAP